jgi:4-alpha-glucanotransferase
MYQQSRSTDSSITSSPCALDTIRLWLEEEDKEESKRIGELKRQQKEKQRIIEEQVRRQWEQNAPPPGSPGR